MIKVMNLVGILAAPFVVSQGSSVRLTVTIVALVVLAIAVILSKRGSIADEAATTGQARVAA